MELRMLALISRLVSVAMVSGIAAAQTETTTTTVSSTSTYSTSSANPGCYGYCRYLEMDYDPGRTEELCDKERGLGSLFLENIKTCADCVRDEGGLSDYFDTVDAQDALKIVNLCQSLYTSDHSEMVSAMSVILETGSVMGSISPTKSPTSTSAPTATQSSGAETTTDASSEQDASSDDSSTSESRAWIAGPVVGSIAGVSGIIGAAFLIIRRRNRRKNAEDTAEQGSGPEQLHEKPELPTEEHVRHELDGHHAVETEARAPPQELYSGETVELPADNGK
ncbi:hypothetical protein ASPVEDRAFT_83424 [Aspergillus versicolor CBS 583.65]|uniref:Uncharacterized protein n=1 Tax=Aspergillus versicolor CBS 583.65 TaxID=1036611 RepID=A0A1L9PK90_ASPVE|nr:uncharacterized protein ASPVEDRAFT_83424 [Aspergillus versicolor CBS 583.65]OJJ01902.1 hypothetical protein ASPVEDRAFT_83424 [Aspergillus versicolor CBS 583.65]